MKNLEQLYRKRNDMLSRYATAPSVPRLKILVERGYVRPRELELHQHHLLSSSKLHPSALGVVKKP